MSNDSTADDAREESMHEASRREKLKKIQELGVDPFGCRFDSKTPIGDIRARQAEIVFRKTTGETVEVPPPSSLDFRKWLAEQGQGELHGPKVRASGRIVLQRDAGKLRFVDIQDWTGRIQLFIGRAQVGDQGWSLAECFDLGDMVGVDGELRLTKTGELTIFAEKLHFLTKSIALPPDKHAGLTDPELRQRMRYVDLAYGEGVLDRFLTRSKIVQSIRKTLHDRGFCEIEGPTLQAIAGGAAARPFTTHHNALNLDLFMRIALELHLKRLLVGGMEKVFEIGRVYRNEGISPKHNPEFTMLEVYEAFGDYQTMMELTEAIICNAISISNGSYKLPWGNLEMDFTPPFRREKYADLLAKHTGVDMSDEMAVSDYARTIGLNPNGKHPDVIRNEIFEEKVEDQLVGPVFVMDYPASICPLTKRKSSHPEIAERFELFVHGMEVANAYTELNDPDLQEKLFKTQLAGLEEEESMARMDHDFIRALKYGMPPAGGLGIGIDRLVMLLTNSPSIRDIILFPLLRP